MKRAKKTGGRKGVDGKIRAANRAPPNTFFGKKERKKGRDEGS
jgi:hypothetical protein